MTVPPESDRAVGIEVYASVSEPCKAVLRSRNDDFRVEEALGETEKSDEPFSGSLPLYRVEKSSIDTFHLARELEDVLKSRVSYAGIKDKRASAVQYVTPTSTKSLRPPRVEGDRFTAVLVGYVGRPLSRQLVTGNRFTIILRQCCSEIRSCIEETYALGATHRIPNFFGSQRFGTTDALSHTIGKELVKRRFREALGILLLRSRRTDDQAAMEARRLMAAGKYEEGCRLLPPGQDVERMAAHRLAKKPDDEIGALRAIPIRLRRFYVQAYQSYLFNRTVSLALKEGIDISVVERGDNWAELAPDGLNLGKVHGVKEPVEGAAVPVVQLLGYAYRNYGSRFDKLLEAVMNEEGVKAREFYVQEMQEVSAECGFRRPHLAIRGASYEIRGEDAKMEFTLSRGGYATVLLREVVKPSDPAASGFA